MDCKSKQAPPHEKQLLNHEKGEMRRYDFITGNGEDSSMLSVGTFSEA